jgi:hypothetical protein
MQQRSAEFREHGSEVYLPVPDGVGGDAEEIIAADRP